MNWTFERLGLMGGASGEAYSKTLTATGLAQADILVREAIQNSVDAKLKIENKQKTAVRKPKVGVVFRLSELTSIQKNQFVEAMRLRTLAQHRDLRDEKITSSIAGAIDPTVPLRLLYVSDHDCVGLSGDPQDSESNFFRLLLTLGNSGKDGGDGPKGGSYGYGKAVYSMSSRIRTIVAYTRFVCNIGEKSRLFGCSYFNTHEHETVRYTGRAWYGLAGTQGGQTIVNPIEGDAADAIAEELGFVRRGVGDTGTSILIVDVDPMITGCAIKDSVEKWWWPRLIDQELDVKIHENGSGVMYPKPKSSAKLRPFIDAYSVLSGNALPSADKKKTEYNKLQGKNIGSLVTCSLSDDPPAVEEDMQNSVAFLRGTSMVVQYNRMSEMLPVCIGVFRAGGDIDEILRKSEPPAHDKWDPKSTNLLEDDAAIVSSVLKRTKTYFLQFQKAAAPAATQKSSPIRELQQALASYLRPRNVGSKMPSGVTESPMHLSFVTKPYPPLVTKSGEYRIDFKFQVWIDETCPHEKLKIRVNINCPIIEQGEASKDHVNFRMSVVDEEKPTDYIGDATGNIEFILEKNRHLLIRAVSDDYDRDWEIRVEPELRGEPI